MDDVAVVAAISAGELDGLAAALDRYAASLYEHCYPMAPEFAAEAVHDTFIVAWCRLEALRDPGRLWLWLETVAANECYRRLLASGSVAPGQADIQADVEAGARADVEAGARADVEARVRAKPTLPAVLPGQVLSACADNTPAGRAYRVSVTHRAGPYGHDGFPKAVRPPGGRPSGGRRRSGGHRRAAAAAAAVVVAAATASTIVALQPAGSSRHARASSAQPGTRSTIAPGDSAALPTTPARLISPSPGVTRSAEVKAASRPQSWATGVVQQAAPATPPQPSPPPAPGTSPPGPAPAAQGTLVANQAQLVLVSIRGRPSVRTLVVTAEGGPVSSYTIAAPADLPGSLAVSPTSGALAAGASVTITVAAATTVPFTTSLTLYPGGQVVNVVVKANR